MPSLTEFLTGLTIGIPGVPIMKVGDLKPFSKYPTDPRRVVTVELLIQDGVDVVDDITDKFRLEV